MSTMAGISPIPFMACGSPSTPAPNMLATMMLDADIQEVDGALWANSFFSSLFNNRSLSPSILRKIRPSDSSSKMVRFDVHLALLLPLMSFHAFPPPSPPPHTYFCVYLK